jgi:hypothetical protein
MSGENIFDIYSIGLVTLILLLFQFNYMNQSAYA